MELPGSCREDSASTRVLSARQQQGRRASRASARGGLLPSGCLLVGARRRGRQSASPEPAVPSGQHRSLYGRGGRQSRRAGTSAPTRRPRPRAGCEERRAAGAERARGRPVCRQGGGRGVGGARPSRSRSALTQPSLLKTLPLKWGRVFQLKKRSIFFFSKKADEVGKKG